MGIFNKDKDVDKQTEGVESNEPDKVTKSEAEIKKDHAKLTETKPEETKEQAFLREALSKYKGALTEKFGYPTQTKISRELVQYLTNYMVNGDID